MSFLFLGRFPPQESCPFKVPTPTCELPFGLTLKDAMYVWWKIWKIRYTYFWKYASLDGFIEVNGEGSVLMDGGVQFMSDKVCPQEILYTCSQKVHYKNNYTEVEEDVYDKVYLTISSDFVQDAEKKDTWYPRISLVIYPGHQEYDYWENSCDALGVYAGLGLIDFFGLGEGKGANYGIQYLIATPGEQGYSVGIVLSVEEESLAQ
jgi:hypothetical protein